VVEVDPTHGTRPSCCRRPRGLASWLRSTRRTTLDCRAVADHVDLRRRTHFHRRRHCHQGCKNVLYYVFMVSRFMFYNVFIMLRTNRAGFWHQSFFPPVLHCVKRKFGYLQNNNFHSGILSQTPDLDNFASAYRSSKVLSIYQSVINWTVVGQLS